MKNAANVAKDRRLAPVDDLLFGSYTLQKARRRALSLLPLEPRERALLVGVGIDLSEEMLRRAHHPASGRDVLLLPMEAERPAFRDASFDVLHDEPSPFGGAYRALLLGRR